MKKRRELDRRSFMPYERFEGEILTRKKTKRAARRFCAVYHIEAAFLAEIGVASILALLLGLLSFLKPVASLFLKINLKYPIIIVGAAYVLFLGILVLKRLILLGIHESTLPLNARIELATEYVRGLMADTYRHYAPVLKRSKYSLDILYDVRSYAAAFALTPEDVRLLRIKDETRGLRKRFLEELRELKERVNAESGEERKRRIRVFHELKAQFIASAEEVRMRYDNFLHYIENAEDYECERYLAMRKNMRVVIDKWYHRHIGNYASVHRPLIEQNISRVMQMVTDRREEFERTGGTASYLELLAGTAFYLNPEEDFKKELIPHKKKYKTFCMVVKKLDNFKMRGMAMPRNRHRLDDYKMLIVAYEDYVAQYTLFGTRALMKDIETHKKNHKEALRDATRCYDCRTPYHKRFRQICPRCEHYLCTVCGACYCNKFIRHFFSFEKPEEED